MAVEYDDWQVEDERAIEVVREVARSDPGSAARACGPLLEVVFGGHVPLRFVFWDDSALGPDDGPGAVVVRSPSALTRLLWAPGELGMARAFVAGDLDVVGPLEQVLAALRAGVDGRRRPTGREVAKIVSVARRVGAVRLPLPLPAEEIRLSGIVHSRRRDAAAIAHHYDVGNEFYRLVLGPSMTYSCARFADGSETLAEAQRSKHDLVCRKLGLHEHRGARLLDVGCGWGTMALHAAARYGASVVAVTLSEAQAEGARAAGARSAGLEGVVEVRLCDYRELRGEKFDAVSSIGMFEHVGERRMAEYFTIIADLLVPTGRLLNHAISKPGSAKMGRRSFTNRYVFPDGRLIDVAAVAGAMERAGFEIRDVESLREHYAKTLQAWVGNLEQAWSDAVRLVGERRARVWRLYMAASANAFATGGLAIHQVLGVIPTRDGGSAMPSTRDGWSTDATDGATTP